MNGNTVVNVNCDSKKEHARIIIIIIIILIIIIIIITSSPKGNDRSPNSKQVFLNINSSQVSKILFQLVKGS